MTGQAPHHMTGQAPNHHHINIIASQNNIPVPINKSIKNTKNQLN